MMNKDRRQIGFYVETLIMIVVFVTIILMLTGVFIFSKVQSIKAEELNSAVTLAQNTAEAVSLSDDYDEFCQLLNEQHNIKMSDGGKVVACYEKNLNPSANGYYNVETEWNQEDSGSGSLVHAKITVYTGSETPVYSMKTAVYNGEREQEVPGT